MSQVSQNKVDDRIGITTVVPIEIVYAAGLAPVDLNNVFIADENASALVAQAEYSGYPRNSCAWLKGIYAAALKNGFRRVIAVVEGDCSQTHAMMETLQIEGVEIIPFSYPYGRDSDLLKLQICKLAQRLHADLNEAASWKRRLDEIRKKAHFVDELAWKEGLTTSFENHYWLVSCSDFCSNPSDFENRLDSFLEQVKNRKPRHAGIRLGYIGVPPIFTDFYDFVDSIGGKIVFNEVQRQFAMPFDCDDIVEQYLSFTYPYDVFARIEDINRQIKIRDIKGLIHYTQSFCFRQIEDIIIRKRINIPILTIEGDAPGKLDARTRIRIESYLEMLGA